MTSAHAGAPVPGAAPDTGAAPRASSRRSFAPRLRRRGATRAPASLVLAAAVGAVVALLPIPYLIDRAWSRGTDEVRREIFQRRTYDLVLRSVTLMIVVTVLCTIVGVTAAVIVARADIPGRRVWQVLLALPLAVPTYVAAFAWVSARPSLAGFHGAILVLVLTSYPYVYLPTLAALLRVDPAHEEVARSLGRGPLSVLWRVTLPQIRPAIAAGALLVALYALSDFGAVALMRYEVFTFVIYGAYNAGFNPARAAILALVLLAVAIVFVGGEAFARGRADVARLGSGTPRRRSPLVTGRWASLLAVVPAAVFAAAIGFPVVRIGLWLTRSANHDTDLSAVVDALLTSLRLALVAALGTTALAVPVGVLAARYRSRLSTTIERSTYVAHALPGIVVAISMVYVGVTLLQRWYQQTPLLVLAYAVLFLPLAVGSVRAAVEQTPRRHEEVARSLGLRPLAAFARVTLPASSSGIGAGAALVFLASMKELPVTLLLHPTGTRTLATGLWQRTGVSDYGGAAPYAAALLVFAAAPTALLGWWSGRLSDAAR